MDGWWILIPVVVFLVGVLVASRRAVTVAELAIDEGQVRVVSGGIAPPLLADLRDVAKKPRIASARIRIVRDRGHAEVRIEGDVSPEQTQRIRNVVGSVPLARLMNAGRKR
jgi:hypothetical protein